MLSLIKPQDQARASRLLLLLVLGNYFVCTYSSAGASYSNATISSSNQLAQEIILDLDSAFKRQLSVLFDNNVELTEKTLKMLDTIPANKYVREASAEFVRVHFPKTSSILVKARAFRLNDLLDLLDDGFSPYRAVLSVYLHNIRKSSLSGKLSKSTKLSCETFKPDTFLNCCNSPCNTCEEYESISETMTNRPRQSTSLKVNSDVVLPTDAEMKKKLPMGIWMPSWFFTPEEMSDFVYIILEPYSDQSKTMESFLWFFLGQIPKVGLDKLDESYYDNMLSLLASLGIPMPRSRYNSNSGPPTTEPGLVALMAHLSLLDRNRRLNVCQPLKYCLLAECSKRLTSGSVQCLRCKTISSENKTNKVQPPPAWKVNEGPWRLPKESDRPNNKHKSNPSESNNPKFGPVSAEKLRIDYQQTTGLYIEDLTSQQKIEGNSIKCNPGDYSCKFRHSCGLAPLNSLSSRKNTGYVVNGENQMYGEWPSYARLAIDLGPQLGTSYCGGTLVTDRHVLTAAHCVYRKRPINVGSPPETLLPRDIKVTMGEHDVSRRDTHEKKYDTKSICASKKYPVPHPNGQTHDDWAILELTRPVKFNEHVQPACLPYEPINRKGKMAKCFLVGTGVIGFKFNKRTGRDHEQLTDIVQKMRVEQVSCRAWRLSDLDRSRECYSKAKRHEGDSCTGDSGGPILCLNSKKQWTLVASVSYGTFKCNDEDKEAWVGVYSRLRTLLDEIKQQCNF